MFRLSSLLLACVTVLSCAICACNGVRSIPLSKPHVRNGLHAASAKAAANALSKELDPEPVRKDRLAVSILHTHPWNDTGQTRLLLCCLSLLHRNVMHATPSDVFIFHRYKPSEGLAALLERDEHIHLVPIKKEEWQPPLATAPRELWTQTDKWSEDYRIMGHWRLTYQMAFFEHLGYDYLLQLDHDMFVVEKIATNMVADMRNKKLDIAWRDVTINESPSVSWGLAELARYHLLAHNITPTQLLEHCKPPSLYGLVTPGSPGVPAGDGWDLQVPRGYFVLLRLGFWHSAPVQHFVKLVLRSGGHVKFRWNEQQVVGMVGLIFAPKQQTQQLQFNYRHAKELPNVISIEECEVQSSLNIPV